MCLWGKVSVFLRVCMGAPVDVCMCGPRSKVSMCTWLVCGYICSRISDCLVVSMRLSMTQYTWVQVCLRCIQTFR